MYRFLNSCFIAVAAVVTGATAGPALAEARPAHVTETITLPAGTRLPVRLAQSIDTKRDRPGTPFLAHVSARVLYHGHIIIPRGTICRGHLVESKSSGRLKGRAILSLSLDTMEINGRRYRIVSSYRAFVSKGHKRRNEILIAGGTGTGAGIGAIAGGGVGALIGAGAGAVAGTTGAVITGKRNVHLAPEARVVFALRQPVRVRV